MADLSGFDAGQCEPNKAFDPIPVSEQEVVISESEEKVNSKGTGSYLSLTFTVISGPYENRKLFTNLNLVHPNEKAVQIAKGDLSAICRAVGVLQPRTSEELHDIPLIVKVGIEKRKDTGELQNRIKGYRSKSAPVSSPPQNGAAPAPAKAPLPDNRATAGTAAPWARK